MCAVSEKHQLQSPPTVGGGGHLAADALITSTHNSSTEAMLDRKWGCQNISGSL